ncbi:MAG: hypothetical protein Q8N77_06620 [Nanoarchaeota archaeon]|nr:hypothetical protein [Nanoarchaeota archaeon]
MRSLPIIILAIMIFCVTSVYAIRDNVFNDDGTVTVYPDNPDMAADYKLNYAIMKPEEFSRSKIMIYDYDLQYVQMRIKGAQESCDKYDGPHCDNVKDYQAALVTLTNMKSQQTGKPTESTSTPNPEPADGGKTKKGALDQLKKWMKDLKDLLAKLLTGWRP